MEHANIKAYPKNAKKHPNLQLLQIAKSIKEFGWQQPIVVDKEGVIIVGHGRWAAYLKHKDDMQLPEPEIKTADLSEEQAKAYRLADNKLNESDWDMNLVVEELKELSVPMLELTGFDSDLIIEPDAQDDEVPEVPIEPKSKVGDLYELGSHRVLCGDSTKIEDVERLMDGKKADMVFTDPPYGIAYSGKGTHGAAKANDFGEMKGDGDIQCAIDAFNLVKTLDIKSQIWWGANYYCGALPLRCGWVVWDKKTIGDRYSDCELAWTNKPGRVRKIEHQWHGMIKASEHGEARVHPTQKPVFISEKLFGENDKTVLDLFLGSGSTLIASEKTGRICYGMELDPKYVDVIVQRYVDYTGNEKIKKNGEEIVWQK